MQVLFADNWPQQPRPSEKAWVGWRISLQKLLNTTSAGKLQICTNKFIHYTKDWPWVLDKTTDRLYQITEDKKFEYTIYWLPWQIYTYATTYISITGND
jgi:hypothetical protein